MGGWISGRTFGESMNLKTHEFGCATKIPARPWLPKALKKVVFANRPLTPKEERQVRAWMGEPIGKSLPRFVYGGPPMSLRHPGCVSRGKCAWHVIRRREGSKYLITKCGQTVSATDLETRRARPRKVCWQCKRAAK